MSNVQNIVDEVSMALREALSRPYRPPSIERYKRELEGRELPIGEVKKVEKGDKEGEILVTVVMNPLITIPFSTEEEKMAEYYTQYYGVVHNLSHQEITWLNKKLSPPEEPGALKDGMEYYSWERKFEGKYGCPPSMWPGFDWMIKVKDKSINLVIYNDDQYNPMTPLANLMQAFIREFRSKECFGLDWSYGCSKSHVDAFGGGAMFVTAEKIEWFYTRSWLEDKGAEFEKEMG